LTRKPAQNYELYADGQELVPKHVGEIINKNTVQKVDIKNQ